MGLSPDCQGPTVDTEMQISHAVGSSAEKKYTVLLIAEIKGYSLPSMIGTGWCLVSD